MKIQRFSCLKNVYPLLIIGIFSFFGVTHNVLAQSSSSVQESITTFVSTIHVNLDSSVDVNEVIAYTTGTVAHHGIYRDIRAISSFGEKMKVSNIKVVNEIGTPYNFVFSNDNQFVRVKIGDANSTFTGQKIYHLSYHVTNAVAHVKNVDEIYWNATGNEWTMPIDSARATVLLPGGLSSVQNACYVGVLGSTEKCEPSNSAQGNSHVFDSPRKLLIGEGLTVAVGFTKGVVVPYEKSFIEKYGGVVGVEIITVIFFVGMLAYWSRHWRDPKGRGIIVAQYDVPDGLTPMEVDVIVNERINVNSISAEIIYLATRGYLKIKNRGKGGYEFIKLKDISEEENDFDKKLFESIFFQEGRDEINISSLSNHFYKKFEDIRKLTGQSIVSKLYYKDIGRIATGPDGFLYFFFYFSIITFFSFFIIFFFSAFSDIVEMYVGSDLGVLTSIMFSFYFSLLLFSVFYYFSPVKTEKGVMAKEYLLGLKMYLTVAEKDRIRFHNAPEKKPELFEKLLPYAMVLGVEKEWAEEFRGIYAIPPSWYESDTASHFSSLTLSNSLVDFRTIASYNLTSSPSSSTSGSGGSSGGGSSGGGGGGGGGGSW
jgi:uncharacterized membrane protein